MKRLFALALGVLVATTAVHAGPDMEAMMAEMQSCSICKHMAPHMATLHPAMTMEIVTLNDGMAVVHTINEPDKVELFHEVGAKMHEAGAESMKMSDAEAGEHLCGNCQDFRGLMTAGAKMHSGNTENGDIMAFTSDDPAVQAQIAELETKWRGMMEMMKTAEG